MAVFEYTARTRDGGRREGNLESDDRRGALRQLERMGLIPVTITERSASVKARREKGVRRRFVINRGPRRMKMKEVLLFTTELNDLLRAGMTLGRALNSLANRRTGRAEDAIITGLRDAIVRGESLSDALAGYPRSFPNVYVSIVRAGEASGALADGLQRIIVHFEKLRELREKVVMALVYPSIVLVFGVLVVIFTMVVVVPRFNEIFERLGASLPMSTRILIGASRWLVRYGLFLAIGLVIAVTLFLRAIKTARGRLAWHRFLLKTPIIRGVIAASVFANFARTLETLLKNGVPALHALDILEATVGNDVVSREIANARQRVTDGTTISRPLAAGNVFPEMIIDMLSIGEETGDMPGALQQIGRRYENELDRNIKILTAALEPLLIVVVAVLVGFVAISIVSAVFSMSSGLRA